MSAVGWLWSAMLMTSLAMTSSHRDATDGGGAAELRMAVIVPYDERRMFSRCKVLPAVREALQHRDVTGHDDVTHTLVPGHRFVVFEADSRCSSAVAPLAAFDLHNQQKVLKK